MRDKRTPTDVCGEAKLESDLLRPNRMHMYFADLLS